MASTNNEKHLDGIMKTKTDSTNHILLHCRTGSKNKKLMDQYDKMIKDDDDDDD